MGSFIIKTPGLTGVTQISNTFINDYMPGANGSFVKIYLYLLCHASEDSLSTEELADIFQCTDADIVRALKYWDKEKVLSVDFDPDNHPTSISFTDLCGNLSQEDFFNKKEDSISASHTEASATIEPVHSSKVMEIPVRHNYQPLEAEVLMEDDEVKNTIRIVETMMGTTLSHTHLQLILYLMTELNFSMDLVCYLYEYALSKGKDSPRYMETIALDWAGKGIRTVEKAEDETSQFNTKYSIVTKHLGITHQLTPAERTIIDGWDSFGFSEVILVEACKRTILQTGDASLTYANKILTDWHKNNVHCLADVEKQDKAFQAGKHSNTQKTPLRNSFQNFPQREYSDKDFSSLEQSLLKKSN